MNSVALFATWAALAAPPAPERRFELLVSPQFSVEVGARSVTSFQRMLFLYDDALATLAVDEGSAGPKAVGVLGRLAKLILIDFPIASFLSVLQHEVFGHGARAREEGQSPQFNLSVPQPYRWVLDPRNEFGGSTEVSRLGFVDRDLLIVSGGIESEAHLTHLMAVQALSREGVLHFSEQLTYLLGRASYGTRFVSAPLLGMRRDGSDPDAYVNQLMNRYNLFGDEAQRAVGERLRWAWATQFLDPMFWLSMKHLFVDYLWRGDRWARVPRFQVGDVGLLPMVRFHLSPFGAEHIVDLVIVHPRLTIDASVRAVSSGLATGVGAGARVFGVKPVSWLELGGALDVWLQPELLHEFRNAYDGRQQPGVSVLLEAHWKPLRQWGLVGQLGYKTEGIVMAQPTRAGFFGFVGVSFTLEGAARPPISGPAASSPREISHR